MRREHRNLTSGRRSKDTLAQPRRNPKKPQRILREAGFLVHIPDRRAPGCRKAGPGSRAKRQGGPAAAIPPAQLLAVGFPAQQQRTLQQSQTRRRYPEKHTSLCARGLFLFTL